jgi:23S rRNA pseudouridine1911/1915/1917 synthase
VQRWIREGRIEVDGASGKPATLLHGGETIVCRPPEIGRDDATRVRAEVGPLVVLAADEDLVVVDKEPGVAVHPGAGRDSGTLVNFLLERYPDVADVGSPARPGVVHRLDIGTSGVLVVARTPAAYQQLIRSFRERSVRKRYLAIVYGSPPAAGEIDAPIGRHRAERKRMTVRTDGRPARTRYRVLASRSGVALLDVDLETGRTHQIRVHLKARGHPLVGDPVYGEARWRALPEPARSALKRFPRPALHAWRITLPHPRTGELVAFVAPVPRDLERLWEEVTGGQLELPRREPTAPRR